MTTREGPAAASAAATLRVIGLALTAVGALVAGLGALLDWVTVTFPEAPDALSPTELGVDLVEGRLVLALCAIALVAVLVTRAGRADTSRRGAAVVVLVAGLALVGIAVGIVATADRRFVGDAIAEIAELGEIDAGDVEFLDELLEVRFGPGVWLTVVGGLVTAVGGLVTLRWAADRARTAATASGDEPAATPGDAGSLPPPPPPAGGTSRA